MRLRVFPSNVSIRSRVIDYYKMLEPRLSTEEKLTKIQRHLREFYAIKVNKKTIEYWITEYEQRIEEIQNVVDSRVKRDNIESETGQFDITGLSCHDPFKAKSTG